MDTELEAFFWPEFLEGCHDLSTSGAFSHQDAPGEIEYFYPEFFSLSVAFNPHAEFPYPYSGIPPDTILQSSDQILFYVHRDRLQTRSRNGFGGLLKKAGARVVIRPTVHQVSEPSQIIDRLLHILYGISSRVSNPDLEVMFQAFDALEKYGCPLSECVPPESEVFTDIIAQAADPLLNPLSVYILAASRGLEQLAVACSFHVLRVPFTSIDEQAAITMGPIYFLRLGRLANDRKKALSKLLLRFPDRHENAISCSLECQNGVMRAYGLIAGYLTWEAKPDEDGERIKRCFTKLLGSVDCPKCKENVSKSVQRILDGWAEERLSDSAPKIPPVMRPAFTGTRQRNKQD
ncbi:uncharacterized protein EI90DRAFT_3125226 [Cantharellus anzutake]|uniref:uncharacterized protein n=1 Tax=Cantharellus anzutake TaxID=1750568 RepID=UPI001904A4C0|nr:uncharacterized protein EI90DRAFT_3125226 [Cantharellus anzutake]KAF8329455.1 hypothetical protein EI90DRAFT_3125226 [Cantharellus anzutake]